MLRTQHVATSMIHHQPSLVSSIKANPSEENEEDTDSGEYTNSRSFRVLIDEKLRESFVTSFSLV
jgi:hypothetical protein